jgi:glycerol-3-phosphate acyltransferase PlsY
MTMQKWICVGIGYLFGNFLTADLVARKYTGKSASETGRTGNPGMANIMESLGFVPGLMVLCGDILKTLAAVLVCGFLFGKNIGNLSRLYAGLGAVMGHNFPLWKVGKGGKGVTCTCAAVVFFAPVLGIIACLSGAAVVILTKYLCVGAVVIPAVFAALTGAAGNREAAVLSLVLTAVMLNRHYSAIRGIKSGDTPKTDVLAAIHKKFI